VDVHIHRVAKRASTRLTVPVLRKRKSSGSLPSENQSSPSHAYSSKHKRSHAVNTDRATMSSLESSRLLSLPRELRDKIWEHAIVDKAEDFLLQPDMTLGRFFYPKSLPPVAFIRHSHFAEIFLVWVRTRSFEFRFKNMIPPSFVWWMDNIGGGRAWSNVKSMSFTTALRIYQSGFGTSLYASNSADIVARATTITHLAITISSLPIMNFDATTGCFTHIRPINELLSAFDFRDILRCERLQSLNFFCCPTWEGDRCIEATDLGCTPQDLFMPLLHWFWHEFGKQGRAVTVQGRLERRGMKFSAEPEWKMGA
jgi:hypothetical protein